MYVAKRIRRPSVVDFLKIGFLSFIVGFVAFLLIAYSFALFFGIQGFLYRPISLIITSAYFASNYVAVYLGVKDKNDINVYKIILFSLLLYIGLEFLRIVSTTGY